MTMTEAEWVKLQEEMLLSFLVGTLGMSEAKAMDYFFSNYLLK